MDSLQLRMRTYRGKVGSALTVSGLVAFTFVRAQEHFDSGEPMLELAETVVVADRYVEEGDNLTDKWLEINGAVNFIDQQAMVESGAQDLGSLVKYDPSVVVPFDATTGDGATAYMATGSSSFNIRGIEGNRVSIEVDGIRQPPEYISTSFDQGSENGSGGMGRDYFDPVMFQLVEIYKGGAGALYGADAMGGVISFRTLDPADVYRDQSLGGIVRGQYFSKNEGAGWQAGVAGHSNGWEFLVVQAGREGEESKNNGSIPPDPMEVESRSWLGKIAYENSEHRLKFTYEKYERNLHADMQSALDPSLGLFRLFTESIDNWQDVKRDRYSLDWQYQPASGWVDSLDTTLYWQEAESSNQNISRNPRELAIYRTDLPALWRSWIATYNPELEVDGRNRDQIIIFDTSILGAKSLARKRVDFGGASHDLAFGVDLSQERSSNVFERVETTGNVVPDLTAPAGTFDEVINVTESNRISFAPSDTYRLGFSLQDEVAIGSHWTVTPGLRADYHLIETNLTDDYLDRLTGVVDSANYTPEATDGFENFTLTPSLDIAFHPTESSRIYAGYAMGTRNPTAEELTMIFDHPSTGVASQLTVPNPDLEAETSHGFKLGYKAAGEVGRFGVEGYYTRYQNFIENNIALDILDDGTVLTSTANQGEAEIYGVEGGGEWNLGSWQPALEGWSLGANAAYTIGDNLASGEPLNTVEPWKAVAFLSYADGGGRFGGRVTGTYTGAVTRTDDTTIYGELYRPDAWFTCDVALWWRPHEDFLINLGVNNLFDEQYWQWSTVRRSGGHLGLADFGGQAGSVDERTTAVGRNFYLSATYTF